MKKEHILHDNQSTLWGSGPTIYKKKKLGKSKRQAKKRGQSTVKKQKGGMFVAGQKCTVPSWKTKQYSQGNQARKRGGMVPQGVSKTCLKKQPATVKKTPRKKKKKNDEKRRVSHLDGGQVKVRI